MKIAILGGGMVGSCYAKAFIDKGDVIVGVCDLNPSPQLNALANELGFEIHEKVGDWLQDASIVVSAVYGGGAYDLFFTASEFIKPGSTYVDMTTALPEMMIKANELAIEKSINFVDVAITGAVNLGMQKTPLLIAGSDAQLVKDLYAPFGARLTIVGDRPGDATKLKLLRSIFTKGIEALSVECLGTAQALGLTEQLFDVLKDIDETPLRKLMESMVYTHIDHSGRREHEVMEASQQMQSTGLEPVVLKGVHALFEKTAQARVEKKFEGATAKEATQWLNSNVLGNKSA